MIVKQILKKIVEIIEKTNSSEEKINSLEENLSLMQTNVQQALTEALNSLSYHSGDSTTINFTGGGFITSSSKAVYFTIPLDKDATGCTITVVSGNILIRSVEGKYIVNAESVLNASIQIENQGTYANLILSYDSSLNTDTNTPVGIDLQNCVLEFS